MLSKSLKQFHNHQQLQKQVDLPSFNEKLEAGKAVVFYEIIVRLGKRKWNLQKRYNQFSKLDADLRPKYPNIPKLPGKTFFKLSAKEDLHKRREELHNYLQVLVNRQDMRTDPHFREFLELDTQIPESVTYSPLKVAELSDLNLGGRDFIYLQEEQLMFVAMSDMNITSRIDAYLTNFSFPWEKAGAKTDNYVSVGAICAYKVIVDTDDSWRFERMWTKSFPSQTNVLHWCAENEMLFVGLDSGRIHSFKIPKEYNYMRYQEMEILKSHTKRVMGLLADSRFGYLYSIGEDGKFKVSEVNSGGVIVELSPGKSGLKQLLFNRQRALFIMADGDGYIHLYNQASHPPEHLCSVQTLSKSCIRGLCTNDAWTYLVAGASDGSLSIFELGKSGKERFAKEIATFQGRPGVRCIAFREKNREILTASQDGMITVWSAKEGSPLYVLQAHSSPITQLHWMEHKQQLISCGKDKRIKVWQLPPIWMDEEEVIQKVKSEMVHEKPAYREDKEPIVVDRQTDSQESEEIVGIAEQEVKKPKKKLQDDEDDELLGWDK